MSILAQHFTAFKGIQYYPPYPLSVIPVFNLAKYLQILRTGGYENETQPRQLKKWPKFSFTNFSTCQLKIRWVDVNKYLSKTNWEIMCNSLNKENCIEKE